jgi:hypothetical protein
MIASFTFPEVIVSIFPIIGLVQTIILPDETGAIGKIYFDQGYVI